jgi:hypothetical protein
LREGFLIRRRCSVEFGQNVFREEENFMKEITRRLYTKPVMLGIAFLVAVTLAVGLFVTSNSRAAAPNTFIPAGDDKFETTNNGETYHNFQASPIPANFFGPGSNQYSGVVPLEGVPIPGQGDIDTIIHRNNDVVTPGSTTIKMTALSLKGINPITVTYTGGGSETWTVRVSLSDVQASTGSMSFSSGSSFDSTLKVWPKFTFTRIPDGATKVLDTGGSGFTAQSVSDGGSDPAVMSQSASAFEGSVFEPAPAPTAAPAPCRAIAIEDSENHDISAAASSCAPVTLTSTNSPWPINRPITEQELLASHNASPPGTKKQLATRAVAVAE